MNKHIDIDKIEQLEEMELEDAMFFLPDDFRKLEDKGRWILFVKEGKLVKQKVKGSTTEN